MRVFARKFAVILGSLCLFAVAGCDAGSGVERLLPPGPSTSADPSDFVLYATLNQGDLVAAYRIGKDGFLEEEPFSTMAVERPRTLTLDSGVLYVGTIDRVVSATIAPDGSLPPTPTAETVPIEDGDVAEIEIRDGFLFAAFSGIDSLLTYELDTGQVSPGIFASSGDSLSDYLVIEIFDDILYAASPSLARIDIYRIQADGTIESDPEPQFPEIDLFGCETMVIRDGVIYAGESPRERINTYLIDADGRPVGLEEGREPISHTQAEERYVDMILDDNLIYAAAFNLGRIDVYEINTADGSVFEQGPLYGTEFDTATFPTSMVLHDGILYVAQAGRGRIDGYIIGGDGFPSAFPSTSTGAMPTGFLNEIVLGEFPPG